MTQLVGIFLGGTSSGKLLVRALIAVFFCLGIFSSSAQQLFAQGGPYNGPGPVPNTGGTGAGGPYSGPGPVPNGTVGTTPTGGSPTVGVGAGMDYGTPLTSAEAAAAAQEAANVQAAQNLGSTPDGVLGFIHTYVLTGIGWVVGQAGNAFDYAITEFIIGFGNLYINGNIGKTIDTLWSTVRDIFNLTFIFGLVYIGFKMILDSSDSSARKMLISLIGAALLVNFSLFITKFVVDFSNIAAAQVFNAFQSSGELSITNGFMTLMGINSLIGVEYTAGGSFAYVIGMLIVFGVLAYVFLAGAIMIIIRFVVLNIYMVFSPLMFLGWVFPSMQGYSKDYWSGFLRQAFFAPAFLFMLYLSYQVADSFAFTKKDFGHMFNPNGSTTTDAAGLIPFFAMVVVFLCASMIVAKKMGAQGASFAMSTSGKIVGGASLGLAARAGRSTLGAGAQALTQNKTFQRVTSRTGVLGKNAMFAAGNIADSSFDARKVRGVGNKLGIGEGKKGGFTTRLKETKDSDHKFAEMLGKIEPEDDKDVKAQRATIAKLTNSLNGTRDDGVREQIEGQIEEEKVKLQTALAAASKPEKVYANQLAYIENKENWQAKQQKVLTNIATIGAGIGATLLTGGIAGGAIAAASAYAVGRGNNMHNKADVKALRKEYGADGSAKKKAKDQEELIKKNMATLGFVTPPAEAHPVAAAKPTSSAAAKPAAHKPAAAAAPAGGGGGGHDHH